MKKRSISIATLLLLTLCIAGCNQVRKNETTVPLSTQIETTVSPTTSPEATNIPTTEVPTTEKVIETTYQAQVVSLADIPAYSGNAYVEINGNTPYFTSSDYTTISFESYSDLDSLGRCGVAVACIGTDIMPTEKRGAIGMVKPSGWHTVRYDDLISDKYLYNRCHLIAYELSGENANTKNLITGTRYMNIEGMLPFENKVHNYVESTSNHVMYRSTPIFEGDNLVANGVMLEGYSVEDSGTGINFNVYCYNVQPGIEIDYATGDSSAKDTSTNSASDSSDEEPNAESIVDSDNSQNNSGGTYILNTNTKKFHYPSCSSVSSMSEKNKQEFSGNRDEVISMGYAPCKRCNP